MRGLQWAHDHFTQLIMQEIPSFNAYIEQSIVKNWDLDALTDYKGI